MKRAWIVFGIALAARLLPYAFLLRNPELAFADNFDTKQYYGLASNLVLHSSFSTYPVPTFIRVARDPQEPDGFRLPVYPLALAPARAIFGDRPLLILLYQIILCSLAPVAVYFLGKRLWGERGGFLAGLILACEPASATLSAYFFADSFFGLVIAISMFFFWYYLKETGARGGALFGLAGGLATLTKPITLFIFPLLFLFGARSWRKPLMAFLTYGVLVGGWILRNYLTFRVPTLTGISGFNLYFHHWSALLAEQRGTDYFLESEALTEEFFRSHGHPEKPLAAADSLGRWAAGEMTREPFLYARAHPKNTYRLLVPEISDGVIYYGLLRSPGLATRLHEGKLNIRDLPAELFGLFQGYWGVMAYQSIVFLYILALLAMAIVGSRRFPRGRMIFLAGLVLFLLYMVLLPGPTTRSRFITALTPAVALIAAGGFVRRNEN